jgi:hypothetical protein
MRKKIQLLLAGLVLAASAAATLYLWKPELFRPSDADTKTMVPESEYYCPMHPQQRSDKEGNCPICSMKLVKMDKPVSESPSRRQQHRANRLQYSSRPSGSS